MARGGYGTWRLDAGEGVAGEQDQLDRARDLRIGLVALVLEGEAVLGRLIVGFCGEDHLTHEFILHYVVIPDLGRTKG